MLLLVVDTSSCTLSCLIRKCRICLLCSTTQGFVAAAAAVALVVVVVVVAVVVEIAVVVAVVVEIALVVLFCVAGLNQ